MELLLESVQDTSRVPGVEVVLRATDDTLLDTSTVKLIGALHRRVWSRRQTVLQRRTLDSQAGHEYLDLPASLPVLEVERPSVVVDLLNGRTWCARLEAMRTAHATIVAMKNSSTDHGTAVVRTRGWESTEPGILVDGRPVISAVFDVAVMLSWAVDDFRERDEPFLFEVPMPADLEARKLWDELMMLAQDKLGVDRGTVRYSSHVTASGARQ